MGDPFGATISHIGAAERKRKGVALNRIPFRGPEGRVIGTRP
jgi:hypothetical protein